MKKDRAAISFTRKHPPSRNRKDQVTWKRETNIHEKHERSQPHHEALCSTDPGGNAHEVGATHLICAGADDAIGILQKRCFRCAVERSAGCTAGPDGKVMHASIRIGDSVIMPSTTRLRWGARSERKTFRGVAGHHPSRTSRTWMLYSSRRWAPAQRSRCRLTRHVLGRPGYGKLEDPFGHQWSVGTHMSGMPLRRRCKKRWSKWSPNIRRRASCSRPTRSGIRSSSPPTETSTDSNLTYLNSELNRVCSPRHRRAAYRFSTRLCPFVECACEVGTQIRKKAQSLYR